MKRMLILIIITVSLSACKSNQRVITDALRDIGGQTTYINIPVEAAPSPWWPFAVVFGIVFLVIVAIAAIYIHYSKQQQLKADAKPPRKRRVTKVYAMPPNVQQTPPSFYSSPPPSYPGPGGYEYEEEL
ncbi:MAG: hypothetical protein U9O54_03980 [Chloroflexota bacterium]|nr:hypothetical protein [Chloroflexota bacterium]